MYVHVRIHVYVHVCTIMYVCMYAYMHVFTYACIYACMHACMHVCIYVCITTPEAGLGGAVAGGVSERVGASDALEPRDGVHSAPLIVRLVQLFLSLDCQNLNSGFLVYAGLVTDESKRGATRLVSTCCHSTCRH
jgi:hypothetical protein